MKHRKPLVCLLALVAAGLGLLVLAGSSVFGLDAAQETGLALIATGGALIALVL